MHMLKTFRLLSARGVCISAALLFIGGACAPIVVGGAALVGVAAVQERSIGSALDDATVQVQISQNLLDYSRTLFVSVGIEVVEGRVLLTGSVTDPQDRVESVRIAWQVTGVSEVLNEIQIADRGGIAGFIADTRITAQLRLRMLSDRDVNDINYSIDTVNGTVYLMGLALDQPELDRVFGYARSIAGVVNVVNHARLRDDPRRS